MNHIRTKRLPFLLVWIISGILGVGTVSKAFSQTELDAQVEAKAFNADIKALEVFRDTPDLTKFEETVTRMLNQWQNKDAKKYSELAVNVGALLAWTDFHSARQSSVAQKFLLSTLSQPEHLMVDDYIGIIHDLSKTDDKLKGAAWTRIRKARIQLWIAGWERIEKEYDIYKDFNEPVYVSNPPLVYPNDPQKMKAWQDDCDKNMRNGEINNLKITLTNLKMSFPKQARQFFIESYCRTPGDLNELRSLLNNAAIDRQAAADVFNEVSDGVRHHPATTLHETDLRK